MTFTLTRTPSSLMNYLPGIYQEDPFLGQFILAFEKLLLGTNEEATFPTSKGLEEIIASGELEEIIANVALLFDPHQTPEDFLPWLASWAALTLRADLPPLQQRDFIAQIIPLYRRRGTKENLLKLLKIFTVTQPKIEEMGDLECRIGIHSTVGVDMYLGGGPPHFFQVTVTLPQLDSSAEVQRQLEIVKSLIELEKPAHTYYELNPEFPSMQIGVHSTIGADTLLGIWPTNQNL